MLRLLGLSLSIIVFISVGILILRTIALRLPIAKDSASFFDDGFNVVAHRGGALEAPENTLVAFEKAFSLDSNILFEFDIHLTKDKEIVVIHDSTLERTTNGKGKVADFTLEEVKKLDAGYYFQDEQGQFSYRDKDIKIPTLREVFEKFPNNKKIIEIKVNNTDLDSKLISLIKEFSAEDTVLIGSFDGRILSRLREAHRRWHFSAARDEILRILMLESLYLEPLAVWNAEAYLVPEKDEGITVLTKKFVAEARRRAKKILIWTVNNDEDIQRLKAFGVNGVISDRPSVAIKYKTL